jgi:hypothetical protein
MTFVFNGIANYKSLDFIACWFILGKKYIENSNAKFAFVSTNSICQGEQVGLLWPQFIASNLDIFFAFQSFKWKNSAKGVAGVSVVIIGLANVSTIKKRLYLIDKYLIVNNINPYLVESATIIVYSRKKSLSNLPEMVSGNKAVYGDPLILSVAEKDKILFTNPEANVLIKKYVGNREFIDNIEKYVLWISDEQLDFALSLGPINERIETVKSQRLSSKEIGARNLSSKAHQFRDFKETKITSIIIPQTGSERREYLPVGFCNNNTIISNASRVIYDSEIWLFSLLTSKLHILWVKAVAGRLKTDMQYSNTLCYNTFPFPSISKFQKEELEQHTHNVLEQRAKHSERTMAELYDPKKMPVGLKEAHHKLDLAVEGCYRSKPFENNEERLAYLFSLYEKMIAEEKTNGTLFAKTPKPKKAKKKQDA